MNSQDRTFSRRRWMWGVGAVAALAGAGVAWRRWQPGPALPAAVEAFWQERFERLDGGEWHVSDWRGKPLLLNFWATWCPPCVQELPMIEAFWRENERNEVQVLALAVDQPSAVRRFVAQQKLTLPVGLAGLQGTTLARSLGNSGGGLPFSVFFASDGGILGQKTGQLTPQDLRAWWRIRT